MFATHLLKNFEQLRALGLARSKRDYARRWLGRGPTYIRDYENRTRGWNLVAPATSTRLREHLVAVATRVPVGIAAEINEVVADLDRSADIAQMLVR